MTELFNVGSLTGDHEHEGASVYWDNDGGLFWCDHCGKYIAFTKDKEMNSSAVHTPEEYPRTTGISGEEKF